MSVAMENIRNFLESSTIHGLTYISSGRKYVRLFWMVVVLAGFTGAAVLIYESFQSWADSPVKTTIETLPITDITFPKVTVCPPKNTYTDLNYDLMMATNKTLDNSTRNDLMNHAFELLYDQLFESMKRNMGQLEDGNRYYNWYHGYTELKLPYPHESGYDSAPSGANIYYISSTASNGTISTRFFGEKYNAENVDTYILYHVIIDSSATKNNTNVTLHFDIEYLSMEGLSQYNYDSMSYYLDYDKIVDNGPFSKNFTPAYGGSSFRDKRSIKLTRKVTEEEVKKQKLQTNPGFRFKWYYSGMNVDPWPKFGGEMNTKRFVRDN